MVFTSKPLMPQGKHVLITGSSTGLGRETALYLAERGFEVIGGVRKQEDGEKLAAACSSGRITPVIIDVTDENSIAAATAQVSEKVGAMRRRHCRDSTKIQMGVQDLNQVSYTLLELSAVQDGLRRR